jgi:hypothetical protein
MNMRTNSIKSFTWIKKTKDIFNKMRNNKHQVVRKMYKKVYLVFIGKNIIYLFTFMLMLKPINLLFL